MDLPYSPLRDEVHSAQSLHHGQPISPPAALDMAPAHFASAAQSLRLSLVPPQTQEDARLHIYGTESVSEITDKCRAALAAEALGDSWLDAVVAYVHGHLSSMPRYMSVD